jgi:[FeFe] hydrogenase H-cluster maturation GTPase HydF
MASRPQIGIFGRRNAGKSSLINVLSGQEVAIVSDIPGTTTDPVRKIMEIHGLGPVVFIDTAGMDDEGLLGEKRVLRSREVILQVNMAILLFTGNFLGKYEKNLIEEFRMDEVPFILVHNMSDKVPLDPVIRKEIEHYYPVDILDFSCREPVAVDALIKLISNNLGPSPFRTMPMLDGLVRENDRVVLVCPVDSEAPEGRLILPQVQVIREILDLKAIAIVLQETQLEAYYHKTCPDNKPVLVVTDSQLFGNVESLIPDDQPLTGFSILLARSKGDFKTYMDETSAIDRLRDGDRVLMMESCSHHSTCEDIGRVKLPRMLRQYSGKKLEFDMIAGLDSPPRPFGDYALVVQCGGCMITHRQLLARIREVRKAGVPVTNYGMAIAYTQGVYERAIEPFKSI